jgi:RimJ/RimL family protein N-acetyltransferase
MEDNSRTILTETYVIANILDIMKDDRLDRKRLELTDGRITLRPHRLSDADATYQAIRESLAELSPWLPFAHQDYAKKETRAWLKKRPGEWKSGLSYQFAILDAKDGTLLGGCGLGEIDNLHRRANLGYWIRTSRAGKGVATAATILLAKWGFEALKLLRIEILVAVENARSLRVAEKAGATREGVLRNRLNIRDKAHDAVMHSLVPGEV